jgi:hypothetical protein
MRQHGIWKRYYLNERSCHSSGKSPSSQWLGFEPRPLHMGYVVDQVAIRQGWYDDISFALSVSFHQCSLLMFIPHHHQSQHFIIIK